MPKRKLYGIETEMFYIRINFWNSLAFIIKKIMSLKDHHKSLNSSC